MPNYRGACHIHSTFSSDGILSIGSIAQYYRSKNYHFVCLTDHSPKEDGETFTEEEMSELIRQCEQSSTDDFIIIPGLECETVDKWHILAIGIKEPVDHVEWKPILKDIRRQGGIAVLAHPLFFENKYPDDFLYDLDGIEVWNAMKGKKYPEVTAVNKIKKLTEEGSKITGFFGQDLHRIKDHMNLDIIISEDELSTSSVVKAFRSKAYLLRSPAYELTPMADFPFSTILRFSISGWLYYRSRKLMKRLYQSISSNGVRLPDRLLKYGRDHYS
ncbi:PHP domain-containing protein [candidate division KSB1 bacterium]